MSSGEETAASNERQYSQETHDEEAGKYDRNESYAEEALPKQVLTKDIIAECISMPYRLGYGFSHAFVKLDCSDRRLNDIEVLRNYIHLRFIILSNNFITDICPVSVIGHLIYLKADNNQIERADCLNSLRFLQFLDLSGNKLTTINDLKLPLLQHLKVHENYIETLNSTGYGLQPCQFPALHTLEVRGNKLTSLDGVGNLSTLRSLYCAENNLRTTEGIANLTLLVRLHLRNNQIKRLVGFSHSFASLEYINLRGNRISRFRTVKELDCLPSLKVLSLLDNPICDKDEYRLVVIGILNSLQRLDKDRVTESERNAGKSVALNKLDTEEEESEPEAMEEHHNAEGLAEEMADEGNKAVEEEEHVEEAEEEEEED
ncbi:hypothetical protein EG68_03733 [Paragonimus skrjabini miyazakii]|uniref:Leucine-rich repeat-containing protein 23 n=1 Tax=Paragonimus skrjabini miyazakii TaxID=59628 RepID=A0A8S9Z5C7_9TREM|nr:hypothetical protein EG68_03733 [Paragonimus skrjabini miyazakii]